MSTCKLVCLVRNEDMYRFLIFTKVLLQLANHAKGGNIIVHSYENKILVGHNYRNISTGKPRECLQHCLADCLCLSFQTCHNQDCQLSSSHQHLTTTSFQDSDVCDYQDFEFDHSFTEIKTKRCGHGCRTEINCCLTSKPCLNAGTCVPVMSHDRKRFTCKCPDGYEGERCEKKRCKLGYKGENCQEPIRSCRGYVDGNRVHGTYTIIDGANNTYQVYCDFNKTGTRAWTLVQSYSLKNKERFSLPLYTNKSVNEDSPSWVQYRLSYERMLYVFHDSNVEWRITCNYDTEGVVFTDYVRVAVKYANPVSWHGIGASCVQVEYINIRGYDCSKCQAVLVQSHTRPLHFRPRKCGFDVPRSKICNHDKIGEIREHSFGYYRCANSEHRCSSSPDSTTQTWFS